MKTVQDIELTVKCYYAEDEMDIGKVLKEVLVTFINKHLKESSGESS